MTTKPIKWVSALLASAVCAVFAASEDAKVVTLKVGSPAPKLQTGKWVQGEPVTEFQPGKAYLIAFWATWSPWNPTLPHLSALHERYKDEGLIVIGQNCWEREEGEVGPFLRQFGDKLSFRIALDDKTDSKDGKMAETWLIPAGFKRSNLPQVFLVDTKGVIAWIGSVRRPPHYMIQAVEGREHLLPDDSFSPPHSVIRSVLDGTFDTQKAAERAVADTGRKAKERAEKAATGVAVKVGGPAPKVQTGKWVQGEPVTELQKGKVYLLWLWNIHNTGTSAFIAHANAIQKKYRTRGLILIGLSTWEFDDGEVAPFLKQPGNAMTFPVALDDKSESKPGEMAETWLAAAGLDPIEMPRGFLVDAQGRIAWIGGPTQLPESLIEAVLDGTFDTKQAGERAAAEVKQRKQKNARRYELMSELWEAKLAGEWEQAEQKLAEIEKLESPGQPGFLVLQEKMNLFLEMRDFKRMHLAAAELSEMTKDDATYQSILAWQLLLDERIKERDLDLAERIAKRANTAAEGKDPAVLDTLARALFMNHKPDKAIEIQKQAVELAKGEVKDGLQATLDSYKKGELPKPDPRSSAKFEW